MDGIDDLQHHIDHLNFTIDDQKAKLAKMQGVINEIYEHLGCNNCKFNIEKTILCQHVPCPHMAINNILAEMEGEK